MKKNKSARYIAGIITIVIIISGLFLKSWLNSNYSGLNLRTLIAFNINKYINPDHLNNKNINEIRTISNNSISRWSNKNLISFPDIKNIKISSNSYEIPVRIYTPSKEGSLPIVIFSHGGFWIAGNLDSYENVCRKISQSTKTIVISVDYRLAPENPYPAGLNDVYAVLEWAYKNASSINGDLNHIAVVGESAGANLSAAVSEVSRDKKGPKISCQVLVNPSTNINSLNSESWAYFTNDFIIPKDNMEKFISLYVPNKENRKDPYVSPLLAKNFKGLPKTLVITAEIDPLRDEGEAYAGKLKQVGVDVELTRYKRVPHGFIIMDRLTNEGDKAVEQISLFLQKSI